MSTVVNRAQREMLAKQIKGKGKEYLTIGIQIYNKVRRETENRDHSEPYAASFGKRSIAGSRPLAIDLALADPVCLCSTPAETYRRQNDTLL